MSPPNAPSPLLAAASLMLALLCLPTSAAAQRVRITGLSDTNFGLVSSVGSDLRRSQSVCVFTNGSNTTYSVSAFGDGPGSSFALSSGIAQLAYDVEWADSSGASSGTLLAPATPLIGRSTTSTNQTCSNGPPSSATLIVVLRGQQLAEAIQGTYAGTLTLIFAAE